MTSAKTLPMTEPDGAKERAEGGPSAARAALDAARAARERASARRAERTEQTRADQALVQKAKAGDALAFKQLVEGNQGRLFAVAFGMLKDRDDAMDVVQDTFIKAHKKLADFEGNAAFSTWLYRICVNLCIDKKRAYARRKSVDLDDVRPGELTEEGLYAGADITPKLSGNNPLRNAADKELGAEIQRALAELSEDHRAILLLREVEGLSYEEISEALEIPRGTVMSRLFHARRNMQKLLRPFLGLQEGENLSTNRVSTEGSGRGSRAGAPAETLEEGSEP